MATSGKRLLLLPRMATVTTEVAVTAALVAVEALKAVSTPWHTFDAKARLHEKRYQLAAERLFAKERNDVANRILSSVPSVKAASDDPHLSVADPYIEAALLRIAADYAPGGAYHAAWLTRYRVLVSQTMRLGASGVRTGLSFRLPNPRAQVAIRHRVTKLTGNVTQTTIQRVRETIEQAMQEGVGVSEIARRVREDAFGGTITRTRARTIARTETVGALNEGQWVAATQGGVMQSKRWLSQRDGRVRESHVTADAEGWIPIAARFSNGLLYPHEAGAPAAEVVQCRCGSQFSDLPPPEANRQ